MKHLFPLLFIFAACNQQPVNALPPAPITGSISYTINDTTNVSWQTSDYFSKNNISCGTTGFYSTSNVTLGQNMSISLYTNNFQTSTYYDTFNYNCNVPQLLFIVGQNNKLYTNKYWTPSVLGKGANDTRVTITALTDSTITGTFEGRVISSSVDFTDTLKISNGSFYLNFIE